MATGTKFIITDEAAIPPEGYGKGLIDRDFSVYRQAEGFRSTPFNLKLIDRAEWRDRLEEQKRTKTQLTDIRNRGNFGKPIPSTDQGQRGYCWAHSTVSGMMLLRAKQNEPYVELSAYSIACPIKNFRDEGGWNSQSMEFAATKGCASSATWPIKSVDRSNVNPEMWADAAKYRVTEWMDLDPRDIDQLVTCLLMGIPVMSDYRWWGHSVATLDAENLDPQRPELIETDIWNSWGPWGPNKDGIGRLVGKKAIPDGMCAPRGIMAA